MQSIKKKKIEIEMDKQNMELSRNSDPTAFT